MKKILTIICTFFFLSVIGSVCSRAAEIQGRVLLSVENGEPAGGDFVMVYCPDLKTGTMSDENGYYSLKLPSSAQNKTVKIEFSRIGYVTILKDFKVVGSISWAEEVILEPQALMLTAAYVTPKGMDAGDYVLSRLWAKSKENRKKQMNYRAEIDYDIATHELPIVTDVLPKALVGLAKFAVALNGFGPLVRYCLKNDDLSASVSLSRVVKDGSPTDFAHRMTKCDQKLPENVKKNVMSLFDLVDLFDMLYGEATDWGQKFAKKHKFKLVGTYEYGDKLVDVLKWSNSKYKVSATIHVVEDDWGILKMQAHSWEGEVIRCEARDLGNGVYMPISFVIKPSISRIRAEQIPALIEEVKKNNDLNKATKARAVKVLEDHLGSDFNPYVSVGYNVRYKL